MNRKSIIVLVLVLFLPRLHATKPLDAYTGPWAQGPDIIKSVKAPVFPDEDFNIQEIGAVESGGKNGRAAIMAAIMACSATGGGRVVVPKGAYLCNGPIHLESNINFHFREGSRIRFGSDYDDYLPVVLTRWECARIYNIFSEDSHAESRCKRGLYIKGNRERGGEVAHVRVRNSHFLDTLKPIFEHSGTYRRKMKK